MCQNPSEYSALSRAAELIRDGGESGLDPFSRISTVKEATQWGEDFAVGVDDRKRFFLQELKHEQATGFLADAWDYYNYRENPGEYCGRNGCAFCSDDYASELEGRLFPRAMVSSSLQFDYAEAVQRELGDILRQIAADVAAARGENNCLTDRDGAQLREAVDELARCGALGEFSLRHQIGQLCWYTPLDEQKIRSLQQHLNRLGTGTALKEDGVYGEKTSQATRQFCDWLANGQFPTVPTVEAAETAVSLTDAANRGAEIGSKLYTMTQGPTGDKYLGLMRPSPEPFYKITSNGNRVRRGATRLGYRQITPQTYQFLKRFEGTGKIVKAGGRVLIVAGVALETAEMFSEINADLNDADGKIGVATGRAVGGFVGSMAGMVVSGAIGTAVISATFISAPALIVAGAIALVLSVAASSLLEAGGEFIGQSIADSMTGDIVDISSIIEVGD